MEIWQLIKKKAWRRIPKALADGADPNTREQRRVGQKKASSPLALAIEQRNAKVASMLIEAGAEIEGPCNDRHQTPLELAALYEQPEVVRELLRRGADPRGTEEKNVVFSCYSAEVLAVVLDELSEATVAELINAPFSKRDSRTPLHLALWAGADVELVELLLKAGAKIDAVDNSGETPLHYAPQRRLDVEVAELLLDAGAALDAKDKRGRTPLSIAISRGDETLRELFERRSSARALTAGPRTSGPLELDKHIDAIFDYAEKVLREAKLPRGRIEHFVLEINEQWSLSEILFFIEGSDEVHELAVDALDPDYPPGIAHLGAEMLGLAKRLKLETKRTRDDFCGTLPGLMVSYLMVKRAPERLARIAKARRELHGGGIAFAPSSPFNWDQQDVLRRQLAKHFRAIADRSDALEAIAKLCYATTEAQQEFLAALGADDVPCYELDVLASNTADKLVELASKGNKGKRKVEALRLAFCAFEELLPSIVLIRREGGKEEHVPVGIKAKLPGHVDFLHDEDFMLPDFCEQHELDLQDLGWSGGLARRFLFTALKESVWLASERLKGSAYVTTDFEAFLSDDEGDDTAGLAPEQARSQLLKRLKKALKKGAQRLAFVALMYKDPARRRVFEV